MSFSIFILIDVDAAIRYHVSMPRNSLYVLYVLFGVAGVVSLVGTVYTGVVGTYTIGKLCLARRQREDHDEYYEYGSNGL
jgi:hypothetical protein